jgi:hypothetical protein
MGRERRRLQQRVLPLAANQRQIVMIHERAAVEQELAQSRDLVEIFRRGCRDRVDSQTRIGGLQLGKRVIRFHRAVERPFGATKSVVILASPVQRELADEEPQTRVGEHIAKRPHRIRCIPAAGRHVHLAGAVVLDELMDDGSEFAPQERLAACELQVLDRAEIVRQSDNLLVREVVTPVQVLPIEAVLAGEIATRDFA